MSSEVITQLMLTGTFETFQMVIISSVIAYILGLPLGLFLVISSKDGIHPMPKLNLVIGTLVNILRSVPFLILAIMLAPMTRIIVGKAYGTNAMIVALTIAAFPYIARLVEQSIQEVDRGVIEAAQSMGASNFQILYKVLLPEAKPSLLIGAAIAVTTILGYSAMGGFIGAGGLGAHAINYGYYRGNRDIMWIAVILIMVILQILQEFGLWLARRTDKRL